MKIKQFALNTASTGAVTPWHFLDWRQNPFAVSFSIDQTGTAAHVVEYGYSDLVRKQCNASNSTTTTTFVLANHGLITGDSVVVSGLASAGVLVVTARRPRHDSNFRPTH